jgi:hypothetical protein
MDTKASLRDGAALAGDALGEGVGMVRDVHRAIAGRVFRAVGPAGQPVRLLHDAISATAYGTTRGSHRVIPRVGAQVAIAAAPTEDEPPDAERRPERPAGRMAMAALNGLYGDRLQRSYPALALPMRLRAEGSDVALTPQRLAAAYPSPSGSLVLFVHGLCESEESWSLAAERRHGERHITYGSLLRDDLGFTPLYLRYNSGRHISDNGHDLSDLLEDLVDAWPVPVAEIVMVGHSMGGLVVRSACYEGERSGYAWPTRVRHVVSLGTPHHGAPLERGVNVLAGALGRIEETRPVARWLNSRSSGIKDLRYGAVVEADWRGHDPDEVLRDRCTEVPLLASATYHVIAATLARHPAQPSAHTVGDLFVQLRSAMAHGPLRGLPVPDHHVLHLGGLHHFDLLNHPEVYDQIKAWIVDGRRAEPAAG